MNSSTKELFPSELEFASQESNAKGLISVKKQLLRRMQKSCKRILICGSACICNLFFQVVLHCTIFLFQKSFKQMSALLFRSTFLTIQFSTGWFWANFSANHPDSGWLAHIRQHNLCCILLKEMACKRRSWVHHKRYKTIVNCGSAKIQRLTSTIDSYLTIHERMNLLLNLNLESSNFTFR